jgi:hypothetical protein
MSGLENPTTLIFIISTQFLLASYDIAHRLVSLANVAVSIIFDVKEVEALGLPIKLGNLSFCKSDPFENLGIRG